MHHSEITTVAKLKDDVKFIVHANGAKFEMSGILVGITPYEISVRMEANVGHGHVYKDFPLNAITDFVNCSVDYDLGI